MNSLQPFDTSGKKPHLLKGEKLPDAEIAPPPAPIESPWRRVLLV